MDRALSNKPPSPCDRWRGVKKEVAYGNNEKAKR